MVFSAALLVGLFGSRRVPVSLGGSFELSFRRACDLVGMALASSTVGLVCFVSVDTSNRARGARPQTSLTDVCFDGDGRRVTKAMVYGEGGA